MRNNPALASAFRRMALGFLVESIAFYLTFVPVVSAAEPIILLAGGVLMMNGFYRAAREVSGFKNPLFLKIIVVCLLFARALILFIFGSSMGLGIFITAAQVLLDLACLHYICIAVPMLFPATKERSTFAIRNLGTMHAVAWLGSMLPFKGTPVTLILLAFMIVGFIFRCKYLIYLRAAERAA